jgi:hypothetical protein
VLLFCVASSTDWKHTAIPGEIVTTMVVKGLITRDALGHLALADRGRAVFRAMLPVRNSFANTSISTAPSAQRTEPASILSVLDGAPNHRCGDLAVPRNITLLLLPPLAEVSLSDLLEVHETDSCVTV